MKVNYSKLFIVVTAAVVLTGSAAYANQTDERIEEAANKSYVFKTYLKDDAVKVYSKDGVVALTGTVKEESHRVLAQETVASLPGVTGVNNKLEFKGEPEAAENSDGWLSMQVKYSLLYNRNVSGLKTQVFVTDGVVTLKGEADSQAQKDLAGEYAKDVNGIKEVKNEMTLATTPGKSKPTMNDQIDDASITAQVKMAFLTHHSTSAFKTGVDTSNGIVTLSGQANSEAGKDMAAKVASDIHGVTRVVNNMTVLTP